MCFHFQNQPQIEKEIDIQINKEIKKVLSSKRSFERLSQSKREYEININKINQEIDNRKEQGKYLEKEQENQIKKEKDLNSNGSDKIYNYKLIIAFNKESSIMITTNDNDRDVQEFKDGQSQLIQTLKGHEYDVAALYFMKNSNYFIS
ncbi:unnamed protein product [Paramecium sonneborni]|uniref:Uncharacterized protein n=1 Tax=Paramecium sonneborni TaxID=65129 RepID=A0A8S1RVF8_9CILI|nr:unnamed protein product [Paramecium sonneborni]